MVYFSYLQATYPLEASLYVRTSSDAAGVFAAIRNIVSKIN